MSNMFINSVQLLLCVFFVLAALSNGETEEYSVEYGPKCNIIPPTNETSQDSSTEITIKNEKNCTYEEDRLEKKRLLMIFGLKRYLLKNECNALSIEGIQCPFDCKKLSYRKLFVKRGQPIKTCHDKKDFACCIAVCVAYRDCRNTVLEAECYKRAFKQLCDCLKQ
ncbi:uncharacterized protein LOC114542463 [Dendronephthya gigantea]|uniref:uncharacterized protein LOC114542463 n=1 Tax=Dendronephthya gigantea TaxID=151771 RepID=UPI00106C1DA7|nr:uncharacterized protein LOC114542463 [Dendronephthya gigantea]